MPASCLCSVSLPFRPTESLVSIARPLPLVRVPTRLIRQMPARVL